MDVPLMAAQAATAFSLLLLLVVVLIGLHLLVRR